VPSNNLNMLLEGLSQLFHLKITRQGDQIILDAPPTTVH
jgi:hypothetical protein